MAVILFLRCAPCCAQASSGPRYTLDAYMQKADSFYDSRDFSQMRYYDSLSLKIAAQINQPEYSGKAYFLHARYLAALQNFSDANSYYQKAIQTYYGKKNDVTTAQIYNDWGFSYGETGALDEQVACYLQAIKIYEKYNEVPGLAQTMSNLSATYFHLEQDEKAFQYALKALQIREKQGNDRDIAISYSNLANMYVQIDSVFLAQKYISLGLIAAEKSKDKERLAQIYITQSLLLNKEKKIQEALDLEQKAISLYEELKDYGVASNRYIAAAFYSNILGDSITALQYFNKSISLASSMQNKMVMRNGYNYLSNFYLEHNNYKEALVYYKKFIALRDSISNSETNTRIAVLQAGFELEKKDFEISQLRINERIKQLEIEKQKAVIKGNKAEARQKQEEINLLFKTKELQEENLFRQQNELEKQKLLTTNNEQKLLIVEKEKIIQQKQIKNQRLIRNLLLGLTALTILLTFLGFNRYKLKKKIEQQASIISMRNNISNNLHDDIGSSLSNIGLLNQLARNNTGNSEKLGEYLEKTGEEIQYASESISDIVWNINPDYDNIENLFARMRRYATDMMDGGNINYHIDFSDEMRSVFLGMDKRRHFYLFYKEAINNLVKHAKASMVNIKLVYIDNAASLTIQDDGGGFDTRQRRTGNGMATMQNRAEALQGRMDIVSQVGKGTRIHLSFPVT